MTLQDIRIGIDTIDTQLLKLLDERARLVHQVGEIKRANGLEIYAPEREEQVFRSLCERNEAAGGMLPEKSVRAIYREIMSASLALEKDLGIAFFGQPGSWTHQAAREKFGLSVRYVPHDNIADVFDAIARGRADYGVVPIENSIEGAVNSTLDVFADSDLKICAQVLLPIENHLLANISRDRIRRVYSHPQVFGQCRNWLRQNMPGVLLIEENSTTHAAQRASVEEDAAALAGKMAAELYRLTILESSIQDSPNNTTRFLVIGNRTCPPTGGGNDRTSLMFSVQDKAGALYGALQPFRDFSISLSRIQSRPSKRKAWEYFFFVDLVGHCEDTRVVEALAELERHCSFVKLLGSYPAPAGL